jgi:hypothetical protein
MVEPRLIHALKSWGMYGSAKDCILVLIGWYAVGGKVLHGWERFCCSPK